MLVLGYLQLLQAGESCDPVVDRLLGPDRMLGPLANEFEDSLRPPEESLFRLAQYLDDMALQEPHALLILSIAQRWYGGERYADVLERYDREVAKRPQSAHVLRLLRRLIEPTSPLSQEDLERLDTDFDPLTTRALHCDRLGSEAGLEPLLQEGRRQGGYPLTHAALAWAWMLDNGCPLELPVDFESGLAAGMASMIKLDDDVTDPEIEAAALLHAIGHGDSVPSAFVEKVVAAQQPNGGFRLSSAANDTRANWHTSVLAFWFLLQHLCPSDERRPMLGEPAAR
jgi:hypothetical protein